MNKLMVPQTQRQHKGLALAARPDGAGIYRVSFNEYLVRSGRTDTYYSVERDAILTWTCSCPDFAKRQQPCKHCHAVAYTVEAARLMDAWQHNHRLSTPELIDKIEARIEDPETTEDDKLQLYVYRNSVQLPGIACSFRFWWHTMDPTAALDPVDAISATPADGQIEVMGPREKDYRPVKKGTTFDKIAQWMQDEDMEIAASSCLGSNAHSARSRWAGRYTVHLVRAS